MQLHELSPFAEERKTRRRVGRGGGSGLGGTAGKGHKGQNARAGGGVRPGFEGGQMPLARRLPKHGFKNARFKIRYTVISVGDLISAFPGVNTISLDDIYRRGLAKYGEPVKILAGGNLDAALNVEASKFSAKAAEQISACGGTCKALEAESKKEESHD